MQNPAQAKNEDEWNFATQDEGKKVNWNNVIFTSRQFFSNNGSLSSGDKGRKRSKYKVAKRLEPNGIQQFNQYRVTAPNQYRANQALTNANQHTVCYHLPRDEAIIVEYISDPTMDMYQIGRSPEEQIDFVVTGTPSMGLKKKSGPVVAVSSTSSSSNNTEQVDQVFQSTVSRYACRILVERNSVPAKVYLYAAGFDSQRNISLGEKATKWETEKGSIDGITTNGILLLQPKEQIVSSAVSTGRWVEVSVGGALYHLRDCRSEPIRKAAVENEFNILIDGSLIDLCGATLLWRSEEGLAKGPTVEDLENLLYELNAGKPQCPIGFQTLILSKISTNPPQHDTPYVYLECGHVQGKHNWKKEEERGEVATAASECKWTCPICLKVGDVSQLNMGFEPGFWVDKEPLTYAFNPCGHVASEKTVRYWTTVPIPHGTNGFIGKCPFCATPIQDRGFVKLIFQYC